MKIAIVGATGMVGEVMLKVLAERNFPVTELILVASEKSIGKEVDFQGKTYQVVGMQTAVDMKPTIAIFSAGGDISLEWAPKFAAAGTTVIDNSSAWRMDQTKKLIVPEINAFTLTKDDKIIANPNCSTIQMVLVLAPLHAKYKIKRVIVSTYQSITGTGVKAVQQLDIGTKHGAIEARQGDELVFEMEGSITLNQNPKVEFDYVTSGAEEMTILARDTSGTTWEKKFPIGPAS